MQTILVTKPETGGSKMIPDVSKAQRPCSTAAVSETESEWIEASSHHLDQETHRSEAAHQTSNPHPIAKNLATGDKWTGALVQNLDQETHGAETAHQPSMPHPIAKGLESGEKRTGSLVHHLDQETHRPEAVVAGNHGRFGVLHPALVQVPTTMGQSHYKRRHALPCAIAKAFRLFPSVGDEHLPFLQIASIFHRILVAFHQITVTGFPHDRYLYLVHRIRIQCSRPGS